MTREELIRDIIDIVCDSVIGMAREEDNGLDDDSSVLVMRMVNTVRRDLNHSVTVQMEKLEAEENGEHH